MNTSANVTPEKLAEEAETNQTMIQVDDAAAQVSDTVAGAMIGNQELAGMFVLAFFGLTLWKSDASTDVGAVVMIPSTFVLATNGWLPFATSVIDATLLVVAGIAAYGVAKYMFR